MLLRPPDRPWRVVVGYAVLLALAAPAATLAWLLVPPHARPLTVRLASALVLAVPLLHLHRIVVRHVEREGTFEPEAPRTRHVPTAGVDRGLVVLTDAVAASVRSRRYFEGGLWRRLAALAPRPPAPPPPRRFGLGPALRDLASLLDEIEAGS